MGFLYGFANFFFPSLVSPPKMAIMSYLVRLFVIHDNVLTVVVIVIKQSLKALGALVLLERSQLMLNFSFALCYCTAELQSSRGRLSSSIDIFSQIPLNEWTPNLGDRYLSTISPDHFFFFFFCISKFKFFDFLQFFFVFVNMGPYGGKSFEWHLPWKYTSDSLPKILHTPRKGRY